MSTFSFLRVLEIKEKAQTKFMLAAIMINWSSGLTSYRSEKCNSYFDGRITSVAVCEKMKKMEMIEV